MGLGTHRMLSIWAGCLLLAAATNLVAEENLVDQVLNKENADRGVKRAPASVVDDYAFLRRVYVDLIGRIPTHEEIVKFQAMPKSTRREKIVDQLLEDPAFANRWTVFFADMLRLRSNADGGAAAIAFVHKAISDKMPYDEIARRFISASGKAGATPEVGFILGDNADPMALAGVTAQTFMGIRIACAQCHDHPFDVWTQENFYGLAAYFGKTRRVESRFTNTVYTQESSQTTVLWPPEGAGEDADRKPMSAIFPFEVSKGDQPSNPIARLKNIRASILLAKAETKKDDGVNIDSLLSDADDRVEKATRSKGGLDSLDVVGEAKKDAAALDIKSAAFKQSELRTQLAILVTDPHNRWFSWSFTNRVWGELIGRGIVNPVDNFSDENPPSHPKTLDLLADEFIANNFDLRSLVRLIVTSNAYQREHAVGVEEVVQMEMEESFLATPMRRMLSEVLYDSVVTAGHLFAIKHAPGKNMKITWRTTRVAKEPVEGEPEVNPVELAAGNTEAEMKAKMKAAKKPGAKAYNLENAIELDFAKLLAKKDDAVVIEKMEVMSSEELEAMRMEEEARNRRAGVQYIDVFTKSTFDDNPTFSSSYRMASPAVPEHFLRVFGQSSRADLGDFRDHNPSMRQALMMLNGRLTHEASRVGEQEPMFALLNGKTANFGKAIELAYLEILTRKPSADEIAEGKELLGASDTPMSGMADLRWVLLNCNEFRFLP